MYVSWKKCLTFSCIVPTGRSVQEALLMTVERRQEEEMDLLMGLLEGAKTQQQLVNIAQGKEDQVEH